MNQVISFEGLKFPPGRQSLYGGCSSRLLKMILLTSIPVSGLIISSAHSFHHRSVWLGDRDVLGELIAGCRKSDMSIPVRTDRHATYDDLKVAHSGES
jgi:hypothetical protein